MTLAVMRFINTTRVGRHLREREFKEEAEARDTGQGVESTRMEGDDKEENREEG